MPPVLRRRRLPMTMTAAAALLAATMATASADDTATGDPAKDNPGASAPYTITDPVPDGFATWDALLAVQNQLDATADGIVAAAQAAATDTATGYGSITVSNRDRSLTLNWKGRIPAQVQHALDTLPQGVTATVHPAAYTLAELQQEAAALTARAAQTGVQLESIGPTPDDSGLQATVSSDTATAQQTLTTTIPLTITHGDPAEELADRGHDVSPFWGGASYTSNTGYCSDSFAVTKPGESTPTRILTANHCGTSLVKVGNGAVNGALVDPVPSLDGADIHVWPNNLTAPYIYRGGADAPATQHSGVAGALGTYKGDWVCSGGAATGEHCLIQITSTEQATSSFIHVAWGQKMKLIQGQPGYDTTWLPDYYSVAAAHGDSGGPIFVNLPFSSKVWAKGSLSGGSGLFSCPQYNNQCGSSIYFVPIKYVLQAANLTLATAP